MRNFLPCASGVAAVLVLTGSAIALEKTSRRLTDDLADWGASSTVTLAYYNNCTGWVWVWSGWSPGEQVGICYDTRNCAVYPVLQTTWILAFSPAPSGYGFTGTVSVEDRCDCTGNTLANQPFLPATSGWNGFAWGITVPRNFLVRFTWAAATGLENDTGLASDHPFAGPTGPMSCGTCFPTTRVSNSLYMGVGGSACPGSPLSDGLCDVEFMHEVGLKCPDPVEDTSWGQIKNLYR